MAPATSMLYPSDLSDQQWALLAPVLPAPKSGGRPRSVDLRVSRDRHATKKRTAVGLSCALVFAVGVGDSRGRDYAVRPGSRDDRERNSPGHVRPGSSPTTTLPANEIPLLLLVALSPARRALLGEGSHALTAVSCLEELVLQVPLVGERLIDRQLQPLG